MHGSKRVAVRDLNPHILCALCGGYLIQATTVIECLHSFCRSCIVNFLETSRVCPICDAQIHKTRPLLNIRPDQTLQSLVYKLVPGLFQDEMRRRREFHATLSDSDIEDLSLEERGEASLEKEFKPGDDHVSLVLQLAFRADKSKPFEIHDRRYLLCPSEVTVKHLKKFIRMKFQLKENHKIEMYRAREELTDDLMLQDIALIYSWRGEMPMNLCYTIAEAPAVKSRDWLKKPPLIKKQSDLSHTRNGPPMECSTVNSKKSESKHYTLSVHKDTHVPQMQTKPTVAPTAVSTCKGSDSTHVSSSVTSLSLFVPTSAQSSSIISAASSVVVTNAPSITVYNSLGKLLSKDKHSAINAPMVSNIKEFRPPSIISINSEPKRHADTAIVSSCVPSAICTSKSKSAISQHDASKLMHSVESILNKTPKRSHHKTSTTTLPWSSVSELQLSPPASVSQARQDKTTSKATKHCHLNQRASDTPRQSLDNIIANPENISSVMFGIKRSQSVIDTVSSATEVHGHTLKPQETVTNDHTTTGDGLLQADSACDVFASYIPKFQKHLKMCAVKRSASYEGPSLTPVSIAASCGDAMEKRNWKKRKLSTFDLDVSKGIAIGRDTINSNSIIDTSNCDTQYNKQQEPILKGRLTSRERQVFEDMTPMSLQSSVFLESSVNKHITPSGINQTVPSSDCGLPVLLSLDESAINSLGSLESKCPTSETKVKSCSRKSNFVNTSSSSPASKNNNTMSRDKQHNDSAQISQVDQIKPLPAKNQKREPWSDSTSVKICSTKDQSCVPASSSASVNTCSTKDQSRVPASSSASVNTCSTKDQSRVPASSSASVNTCSTNDQSRVPASSNASVNTCSTKDQSCVPASSSALVKTCSTKDQSRVPASSSASVNKCSTKDQSRVPASSSASVNTCSTKDQSRVPASSSASVNICSTKDQSRVPASSSASVNICSTKDESRVPASSSASVNTCSTKDQSRVTASTSASVNTCSTKDQSRVPCSGSVCVTTSVGNNQSRVSCADSVYVNTYVNKSQLGVSGSDRMPVNTCVTKNQSRMSLFDSVSVNTRVDTNPSCVLASDSVHVNTCATKIQSRVFSSESLSGHPRVSQKAARSIQSKSGMAVSNKCESTLSKVSTNSRQVDDISVDISSSSSDVSNVTSPTSYVTSPGTEDRTDGSGLPEIQTSCENNCVVTFAGKVVPLDLSVKNKK